MRETGELVLVYGRGGNRRRNWHLGLRCGLLIAAGFLLWKFGGSIGNWTARRRLVFQAWRAQQRCLQSKVEQFPAVTITNSAQTGQALGFTAGGSSPDLGDFLTADAVVTSNARPLASNRGRSVLAVRDVVRPDGTHRLVSVETEGASIATYVWSVGSPVTPGRLIGHQHFSLILPPHRPFALTSAPMPARAGAAAIHAGFTDTKANGGIVEFALGNDDHLTLNAPFGWTTAEMPDVWAPAGRPPAWPQTVTPPVASLPFTGRAIGFEDNSTVLIAGDTGCCRIRLATGNVVGRFDYGQPAADGVRDAVISPDCRRVMVTDKYSGWFVCDPIAGKILSTQMCFRSRDVVRTQAFSPDSTRLITGSENGVRVYDSTGTTLLLESPSDPASVAAGVGFCIASEPHFVEIFAWDNRSKTNPLGVEEQGGRVRLSDAGDLLLISDGRQVGAYEFPKGTELFHRRPCADIDDRFARCRPAFLDHDKWVVLGGEKLGLYLLDLPRAEKNLRIDGVPNAVDMAVSPDGRTLAVLTANDLKLISSAAVETAAAAAPAPDRR
jgi:hypothetical protein